MPITKYDGRVIIEFVDGDIMIAPSADTQEESAKYVSIGTLDGKKFPIDTPIPEVRGMVMNDWAVKMYFKKSESIDALIHVLEDFKKSYFGITEALSLKGEEVYPLIDEVKRKKKDLIQQNTFGLNEYERGEWSGKLSAYEHLIQFEQQHSTPSPMDICTEDRHIKGCKCDSTPSPVDIESMMPKLYSPYLSGYTQEVEAKRVYEIIKTELEKSKL